jgi:hypothetical protein
VQGSGCRVQGSGLFFLGARFGVQGLEPESLGWEFRFQGLGF